MSVGMFEENWTRYVLKLATGVGKTKVLSLLIAWSYFHKMYETDSSLSRNFLLIAPNIIVLDRLKDDFDELSIFYNDPVIPENGHNLSFKVLAQKTGYTDIVKYSVAKLIP
jgi:type III restriction enzyme